MWIDELLEIDEITLVVDSNDSTDFIHERDRIDSVQTGLSEMSDEIEFRSSSTDKELFESEQNIKQLSNRLFKYFNENLSTSINNIENSTEESKEISTDFVNNRIPQMSSFLDNTSDLEMNSISFGADIRVSLKKLDKSFTSAIARMLGSLDGNELVVSEKNIESTLSQLTNGTYRQKVTLLFKFMDISENGSVSEEEAQKLKFYNCHCYKL